MSIQESPKSPPQTWGPSQVGWSIATAIAVVLMVSLFLAPFVELEQTPGVLMAAVFVQDALLLGLAWAFGPQARRARISSLGFHALPLRSALGMTVVVVLASVSVSIIYFSLVEVIAPNSSVFLPKGLDESLPLDGAQGWWFIAVVLLGPFAEEVFFRGFVFTGLAWKWGPRNAALVSAALFAASHFSSGQLVPAFASGLLLAWAYYRTRSLWPAVLAHTMQNSIAFAAATV
jgi:membrane protease YdiL (CAAX protease family)